MITKGSLLKSASTIINYLIMDKTDKQKERGTIIQFNNCFGSRKELAEQFTEIGNLSTRCEKKYMHISFSFPLSDCNKLTIDKMSEIAQKYSDKFNLNEHPWIAVLHEDTPNHPHFHLAFCTINPNTKKSIKHDNNYKVMSEFSRECEAQYGFESVLSPRKFLPKDKQKLPRKDTRKENLKASISDSLEGCTSIPEFEDRMKTNGYLIEKGRGIAFKDSANVRFKGSQVGFSFDDIKKQIINNLDITPKYDIPKTLNLSL
jgi:hypothetical protein